MHQHSSFSGDARADPGILAVRAKSAGYNAVMLTDHDRGASFQIQGTNGNYLSYGDALSGRWIQKTTGTPTASVNAVETTPVQSGTSALHLKVDETAGSTTPARTMAYAKRGASLRAGGVTLDFWVYPQQIDPTAGVDVSVSLGGDSTTGTTPFGYTANGTPVFKKSTVLVWQLGKARAPSTSATAGVYVNSLQYQQGAWNHYTVDVRTGATTWVVGSTTTQLTGVGLNGLSAADQPADYDVLSEVKMEAASTGGTADAYFDNFTLRDLAPNCPAADFVYRNQLIDAGTFDGTNAGGQPFKMFPAREMGQNNHTNQFNFDFQAPQDYNVTYNDTTLPAAYGNDGTLCASTNTSTAPWKFSRLGSDNIPSVQASGYPAQNNHPGITDTTTAATQTQAHGADFVEVLTGDDHTATWDSILQQNHVVIGTYGSDAHEGVGSGMPASNIYAPSLTLDGLMRGLFEGRAYGARNNFGGRLVFNLDGSAEPYPARYPVYVPSGTPSGNVTLDISGGLSSGQTVRWITNSGAGPTTTADPVSGATYRRNFSVPLSGSFTYVRAEVRDSANTLIASTQPIFFESVTGMVPTGLHVDWVTPTQGCACSVAVNKGLTSLVWGGSSTGGTLTGQMTNPSGSTVGLLGSSPSAPTSVTMDGAQIATSTSLAAFQAATGDAWFYDSVSQQLYLQDQQSGSTSSFAMAFGSGGTDNPPTVPGNVAATTGTATGTVDLSWSASTDTDGTGVQGYRIYRDGAATPTAEVITTSYTDTGLTAGSHSYTVSAYDTAALESAQSPAVTATASAGAPGATSGTVTAVADATVDSSVPTTNAGTTTTLRVDTSPTINSYLRFAPQGFAGTVTKATLSLHANSSLAAGVKVCAVADDTWTETGINYTNAPPFTCPTTALIAKPAVAGARVTVDVTSLMGATNAHVNLVLIGQSTTGLSLGSRSSANPPQLTLATTGSGSTDNPPTVPGNVSATTGTATGTVDLSWTASTDTDGTGVQGYRIYRDGATTPSATTNATTTSYTDTGLTAGSHSYTVSAYDTAGLESAPSPAVSATATGGTTDNPPTVPGNVSATTGTATGTVDLSWSASTDTDGTGVQGYRIYRDGATTPSATTNATTTSYTDTGLTAGSHSYTVSAYDTAGLESAPSPAVSATATGGTGATSGTVTAIADATVESSLPTKNAGTATTLRVDNSPIVNSYLRFAPQGFAGTVTKATLSLYANSSLAAGFQVCAVADNTWTETGVTYTTAPAYTCPTTAIIAKPAVSGARVTVDVTGLMQQANGDVNFVLIGQSGTALSLGSRQSTNPPQLTLTTTG